MAGIVTRTPWHVWLVGILAVLFNAIGVFDYLMSKLQGPAYMASAGMTPAQIAHYQAMPAWMTAVWAIGVFAAFAASVMLVLRRRAACPIFVVSFAAFLLNLLYNYVLTDGAKLMGPAVAMTDAIITAELAFLIWYTRRMSTRGVLR